MTKVLHIFLCLNHILIYANISKWLTQSDKVLNPRVAVAPQVVKE